MAVFFPKKALFSSNLSAKVFLQKLTDNIYIPKETGLFKVNKTIRAVWSDEAFYGTRRQNAFALFYHKPFKRDGGGVRFNGVVVDTENGCKIGGYIRHGFFSYLFSAMWTLLFLMVSVVLLVENPVSCVASLGLMTAGNILIFSGSKNAKQLMAFIEDLCENEDNIEISDIKE